jgi:hypothetical protein
VVIRPVGAQANQGRIMNKLLLPFTGFWVSGVVLFICIQFAKATIDSGMPYSPQIQIGVFLGASVVFLVTFMGRIIERLGKNEH